MTVSSRRRGTLPRRKGAVPTGVGCVLALAIVATGCTASLDEPAPTEPVTAARTTSPTDGATAATTPPTTAPSVTPVTDDGMVTGPGVDDASISLGMLVDPVADRGFTAGLSLWQQTVNNTGGICGRTIQLIEPADRATVDDSYAELGRSTLGLITLEPGAAGLSLASRIRSDRIPAFTPEGTAEKMAGSWSPVVLGATDDILAINTAAHLMATGVIGPGGTLGVQIDDSASAADVLAGLTWWAMRNDVTLQTLEAGQQFPADIPAIFAATGPEQVAALLAGTAVGAGGSTAGTPSGTSVSSTSSSGTALPGTSPSAGDGPADPGSATMTAGPGLSSADGEPSGSATDARGVAATVPQESSPRGSAGESAPGTGEDTDGGTDPEPASGPVIATTLAGYDPTLLPSGVGDRLLIGTVTPASGAEHPVVQAVDTAFADADLGDGGPRMLSGYGTGDTWGRLLESMCDARKLTRDAAGELLTTLPAASPDGLFGPVDPVAQVTAGMPANRVSAVSVADPDGPGGLRAVTLLESAPGIGDYRAE